MRCVYRGAATLAVLLLTLPGAADLATAVLYRCVDPTGATVFTDSASQLFHCDAVSQDSPDVPSQTAPTSDPAPLTISLPSPESSASVPDAREVIDTLVLPHPDTIRLQRVGQLFVASVELNGSRTARLIVDTGASHTILSHKIAVELGLFADGNTAPVSMKTVGGSVQAEMVQVRSIRIGTAEVHDSLAAIYDLPDAPEGVEGLLGLSVLRQYAVTLDAARSQLHLNRLTP